MRAGPLQARSRIGIAIQRLAPSRQTPSYRARSTSSLPRASSATRRAIRCAGSLHALQVVRLAQQRRRAFVIDLFGSAITNHARLELAEHAPVPSPLLIQVAKRERRIAHVIADLQRRAKLALAEHVAKQHR